MSMIELRIHSKLAIKTLEIPALSLWYLCRGLDEPGSGRSLVSKELINKEYGKHRTTIWRWLNNTTLFHRYRYDKEQKAYIIYYKSLVKVCLALKVKSLGGIGWSDTTEDLAQQAALIEALKIQQQSQWLAKHCSVENKKTG